MKRRGPAQGGKLILVFPDGRGTEALDRVMDALVERALTGKSLVELLPEIPPIPTEPIVEGSNLRLRGAAAESAALSTPGRSTNTKTRAGSHPALVSDPSKGTRTP